MLEIAATIFLFLSAALLTIVVLAGIMVLLNPGPDIDLDTDDEE